MLKTHQRSRVPGWRNWQTRRTQNPVLAREWEFDPPSGHHPMSAYVCGDILDFSFGQQRAVGLGCCNSYRIVIVTTISSPSSGHEKRHV
jgi:hypothetical protein